MLEPVHFLPIFEHDPDLDPKFRTTDPDPANNFGSDRIRIPINKIRPTWGPKPINFGLGCCCLDVELPEVVLEKEAVQATREEAATCPAQALHTRLQVRYGTVRYPLRFRR